MIVGIIHPGAMGSSLGAALVGNGHEARWASEGRGPDTHDRASADGVTAVATLEELGASCDMLISVCPPAAAHDVADRVAGHGFAGLYVDANAVAPATTRSIADTVEGAGARFVDGGIVGPPARHRGLTVLYLSGAEPDCAEVAGAFSSSPLETHVVGDRAGAASAVKMAFAAWTKGTSALLLAIRALADTEGVTEGLDHAWSVLTPELAERLPATVAGTAPKAWRFAGEMREIAGTFEAAGLPGGFHHAAAEIYEALADLRDCPDPTVDHVVHRLAVR